MRRSNMLDKIREGCFSLMYLTAISDMNKFVTELEKEGWKPKEIIRHLRITGRSADLAIDTMLRDMETKSLRTEATPEVRDVSPRSQTYPR